MNICQAIKDRILELDSNATFDGSIVYTKLDYGILQDIFECYGGETIKEKRERVIDNIIN